MGTLFTLLRLAVVLYLGFLLTTKVIPWIAVRVGRRLGFRMRMTPITAKRVARFKRIRRGYVSFLAISTLFVTSLFLELLVNSRPLVMSYDGSLAFPAFREWCSKVVFFVDIPTYYPRNEWGQLGESEVDYNRFENWSEDPATMERFLADEREVLATERAELDATGKPGPESSDYVRNRFERQRDSVRRQAERIAQLEKNLAVFRDGNAWALMPLYSYGPTDLRYDLDKAPPNKPSMAIGAPLGTDTSGRDVLPLLVYGFRISIAFALVVATFGYCVGVLVGGMQGYYGGWVDIASQRVVEIWSSIPFLFTIMILASLIQPSFILLAILLVVLRSWIGITYYVRGEFYREKAKDYVQAAIGAGVSDWKIITKHILPNSLVPVVTFAPFGIVAYIGSLVSLDYLGFGLPPGTPSWGGLLRQGLENVKFYPHLTIVPVVTLAVTLYSVVMIGEAVREAFDPKVFSRLR